MINFWRIGDNYINPAHIIRIERFPAEAEYMGIDDETGDDRLFPAKPFKLWITLTEDDATTGGWDHNSGFGEYYVHRNMVIKLKGAPAERMDKWLMAGDMQFPDAESEPEVSE